MHPMRPMQETEEAIQAGNRKYNEMLTERMRLEDELTDRLQVWPCYFAFIWQYSRNKRKQVQ